MKVKENINIPIRELKNCYVIADFDKTITAGDSTNSWCILSSSPEVPNGYKEDMQKLHDHYRPIELNENMDYSKKYQEMENWWKKHTELFIKYKFKEELIKKNSSNKNMKFRKGAKEFINYLSKNNIPLIIMSAGIANTIEFFLEANNIYKDNIYIISNTIKFENGIASGIENRIIHCMNKNEISLPNQIKEQIKNRNQVILLGDQLSDLNMLNDKKKEVISIAFLNAETSPNKKEFEEKYSIVLEETEDYNTLKKLVF